MSAGFVSLFQQFGKHEYAGPEGARHCSLSKVAQMTMVAISDAKMATP